MRIPFPNAQSTAQSILAGAYAAQNVYAGLVGQQNSLGGLGDNQLANHGRLGSGLAGLSAPMQLTRYDAAKDELVPVTQDWVNDVHQTMNRLYREREEARAEIGRLKGADELKIEFGELNKKTPWVAPIGQAESEQDRMWQAVRMAASC